jgi:hypothetical protein
MDDDNAMVEMMLAAAAMAAANKQNTCVGEENAPTWGGSHPGKSHNKNRDFKGVHKMLLKHFFKGPGSVCNETNFE